MEASLHHINGDFLHHEKGWPIYLEPERVAKRIHLEPGGLRLAQDVASLICAKTKVPRWHLTAGESQTQDIVRARYYLIAFLRFHPLAKLSFPKIGDILNRDHTTCMSGLNRLLALVQFRHIYPHAGELEWISKTLPSLSADYPQFNLLKALGEHEQILKRTALTSPRKVRSDRGKGRKINIPEACEAYRGGVSGYELAKRYDVSRQSIYAILRRNGVVIREKRGRRP